MGGTYSSMSEMWFGKKLQKFYMVCLHFKHLKHQKEEKLFLEAVCCLMIPFNRIMGAWNVNTNVLHRCFQLLRLQSSGIR